MVEVKEVNSFLDQSKLLQIPSSVLRNMMEFLSVNTKPTTISRAFRRAAFKSISDEEWSNIIANYLDASFLIKSEMEDWILSAWTYFDDARKYRISSATRCNIQYPDYDGIQEVLDDIYFPFEASAVHRTSLILHHTTPDWMGRIIINAISLSLFNESQSAAYLYETFSKQFHIKELIGCLDVMKTYCLRHFDLDIFWNILNSNTQERPDARK